jgi:hypothetical protein
MRTANVGGLKGLVGVTATVFVLAVILAFQVACVSTTEVEEKTLKYPEPAPPLEFSFNYEPAKEPNPAPTTIALVGVSVTGSTYGSCGRAPSLQQVLDHYISALNNQFQATLLAKGFTLTGPFSSREDMTYGEKEKALLLLVPELKVSVNCQENKGRTPFSEARTGKSEDDKSTGVLVIWYEYEALEKAEGSLTANADIQVTLYEPLTGEKLWTKAISIPLPAQTYSRYVRKTVWKGATLGEALRGQERYRPGAEKDLHEYDWRPHALAAALSAGFSQELATFSKYFDPREIAQVAKDAEKVRKLKRY